MTEASQQHFDAGQLVRLLKSDLAPLEESKATQHIEECDHCRKKLEEIAGQRDWWAEVGDCLSHAPSHLSSSIHLVTTSSPSQCGTRVPTSTADFAVEFLEPSDHPDAIGRLDEFEILGVIGQGGMGIVLKGFQSDLRRLVAIKVMAPHLAVSGPARQRFEREARAAAAIVHPNVMAIHSVNSLAKLPYLVMPFVACESLQQRIDREGALTATESLRILNQTAAALSAAHSQGLVHRDVKPANILLEQNVDRVLLTDFGLARAVDDASLTRTGAIAGTPQFMSPEQAKGDTIDAQSDLFSLGAVAYTMCTGRPPFRAETSYAVMRRIIDSPPRPVIEINPEIPQWLGSLCGRLLSKEATQRPTAEELVHIYEQCLAHLQQPAIEPLPEICQVQKKNTRQLHEVVRYFLWLAFCGSVLSIGAWATLFAAGYFEEDRPGVDQAATGSGDIVDSGATAAIAESNSKRIQIGDSPVAQEQTATRWDDPIVDGELGGVWVEMNILEQEVEELWSGQEKK